MGKDVKKKFTVSLDIEMKDAEKQVKATVGNLKTILADLGNASDKMGYFKDLVDYIGQIDTALTALRNKNKDAFDHMFDGLDENLRKQLEDLFGTDGATLSQLNVLHDKLATLTPKSGIKELRNFAKEIEALFTSIKVDSPFEDVDKQFFGKANAQHIQLLTDALNSFANVWDGVNNKIKNGFGFGGSGGDTSGVINGLSKEVQEEIDKLKKQQQEIQEIVNAINNPEKVNFKLSKKSNEQVEQLKTLKQAFLDAASAKTLLENSKMTGTNEYLATVANYVKAAAELKSAFESEDLTNQGMDFVNVSGMVELQDADKVLDSFLKKNQTLINKVQNMYSEKLSNISNQMEFLAKPYEILKEKIQEYGTLQDVINNNDELSDDEEDEIYAKIDVLEKYLFSLDKVGDKQDEINKILAGITFDGMSGEQALVEFCNLLSVDVPKAAQKAEDALKSVDKSGTTIDSSDAEDIKDDILKIGSEAQESSQEASAALDKVENKVQDVTATFQELVDYISKLGTSPKSFFTALESGAQIVDNELQSILQSLNLIDSNGKMKFTIPKSGSDNKGGMISDEYALIARPIAKAQFAQIAQPKLEEAAKEGANVGTILGIFKDELNGVVYELQKTVKGKDLLNQQHQLNNPDFLNATDEQLQKFIKDLAVLQKTGLYIDQNGKNILYDKDEGFSIVDLFSASVPGLTVGKENSVQQNVQAILSSIEGALSQADYSEFSSKLQKAMNDVLTKAVTDISAFDGEAAYKDAKSELGKVLLSKNAPGRQYQKYSALHNALYDIHNNTDSDDFSKGLYQDSDGDHVAIVEVVRMVKQIEKEYNDNLTNVKDYLQKLYGNLDFEGTQHANLDGDNLQQISEDKINGTLDSFKELVNYISQSGTSPSKFFDKLESGAQSVDDELEGILQSLNLIDSFENINLESIKSGFTNKGGFVSDQYTMIARPDWYLPKIESLQPMLAEAQQAGAKIGAIVDIIEDKANGLIYEVQNTVAGTAAFSHHNYSLNQDALNATDDQIKGLISTLQVLQQKGLFVDWGGDNVLYDKDQGFSIIDLGNKGGKSHTVSVQNTMQENLDRLVSEMFKFDKGVAQSPFVDNLYKLANDMGIQVSNPNAPVSNKQHKDAQDSANKTAAAVKAEENAHEQNTAAINAENTALQAQIELKKKAQSMKWEAFALDESSADLKKAAGFQTLSDMEKFWKQANYEKQIDWHEISKSEAQKIFDQKLPKGLADKWYGPGEFHVKDRLENEVLADDEIRNAALNYLYYLYKDNVPLSNKNPNVKTFEDFLNTEFTVYRGDDAPLIYGDESKLSFSFKKSTANAFDSDIGTAKIIPKETMGNAGSIHEGEVETFVPSYKTSWFKQTGETFEDFYNKQTKEMQDEINVGLINLEKQRVSDILGSDFTKLTHKAGKTSDFQNSILKQFQQGIIPDSIISSGLGDINDEFADAYNGLSNMGKKLAAYYASMDAVSATLPEQLSIDGWKEASKKTVGKDANLFNAVLNDPTGVKKHVANLTGELGYNLFDKSDEEIKAETEALKQNTKAIKDNAQAKQDASNSTISYDDVQEKLLNRMNSPSTSMEKFNDFAPIYHDLVDVAYTSDSNVIQDGLYQKYLTGEMVPVADLIGMINNVEQKYGENLDYVKDYLNQVYGKLDVDNVIKGVDDGILDDFDADEAFKVITGYDEVENKLDDALKNAVDNFDFDKQIELAKIKEKLFAVQDDVQNEPGLIDDGKYLDLDSGKTDWTEISKFVSDFETKYNENLDYVHDYLKGVFSKATDQIDNIFVEFEDDDLLLDIDNENKDAANDFNAIYWKLEAMIDGINQEKCDFISKIQSKLSDISYDTTENPEFIAQGTYLDMGTSKITDWAEVSDLVSDFEAQYGENLEYVHDYLKQVFAKQHEELDKLFNGEIDGFSFDESVSSEKTYSVKDYEDAYKLQDDAAQKAINDLAKFYEKCDELDSKLNLDPIEFMFGSDKPTIDEQNEVLVTFNALKAKIQEVKDMPIVDTEDDKKKLQELQAEAVGLQNKLRNAKIEGIVSGSDYKNTYGLPSVIEGIKMRQFIEGDDVFSIVGDLEAQLKIKEQNVYDSVTQDFKDMIDNDTSDSPEQFFSQLTQQLKIQKEITAEKQKQAALTDEIVDDQKTQLKVDSDKFDSSVPSGSDYALESTLQQTNSILSDILSATTSDESGEQIAEPLNNAVTELNKVASGIVEHQKAQKTDTSAAMAKITDPTQYKQVSDIAMGSVGQLGSEVQINSLKALADGVVKVEGAFQNVNGEWEGFTVKVNESNEAVDLAINKQSAYAKALNDSATKLKEQKEKEQKELEKLAEQAKLNAQKEKDAEALEQQKIKDKAQLKTITDQSKELYKSLKINPIDTSDSALAVKDTYAELTKSLEEYKAKKEALTDDELNGLKQIQAHLLANAKLYAEQNEQTKKKNKVAYGSNIMATQMGKHNNLKDKIGSNAQFQNSDILTSAVKEYEESFSRLETVYNKLKNINPTEGDKAEFKAASAACSELGKEVENLIKTYANMHSGPNLIGELELGADFDNNNENSRKQALLDYVESMYGAKAQIGDFKNYYKELLFTIDNGDGTFTEAKASIDNLGTSIVATAGDTIKATSKFSSFIDSLGKKFGELWIYAASRFGVDEIIQQVRQGVGYVKEIDTALTELKKVTNETDEVYSRFLQTMSSTAGVVGSTVSELTTMASEWARLGYSIEEAGKLAESTAILLNVSEFENATDASEALISTMQAFQYTADESQHVVDILNEVGNNFAVSSDGLATALQDSASALMEAGNSLEQSVALVAAANRVVQDPNSVGSALRTISLRLRGTSVEVLEEMGEETDGAVESVSKMQEKLKALTGVDILTDSGAYKDTYTILKDIAAVWEDMSSMDQAAALELMAGKNRANTLAAILNNIEDLEGAYESALNAEGSAMRENEAYLDSIQGRIDLFTNALQTFWMNFISSDMIKGIVDIGTMLMKLLDTIHGKIIALVGAFMVYKRFSDKTKFSDMFKGAIETISGVIKSFKTMTVATASQTIASKISNKEIAQSILLTSGLSASEGMLTKELVTSTAAMLTNEFQLGKLSTAEYLATMSTMGLKTALQGLWNVLLKNPIYLAAAAIAALALAFDHFHTTAQEAADAAKEAFDEIQSVVESTKSTIQSLESELSAIQDKIDELDGKKLSFAEEQELEKLKKQRTELEHSLKVQQQLLELQRDSSNKQAIASMKAYTKASSEGAEETQGAWKKALTTIGIIAGTIGGAVLTGGASLGVQVAGAAAGAIGLGVAGNKAGEAIGSSVAENEGTYDSWYETYTKALEAARKDEQDALEKYQKDSSNIDKLDKWQEAQQKTSEIETEMYEHLSQMQQYYAGLEYSDTDEELNKELDAWYNFLDKFSIAQGASGAEVTALDRIFGDNASAEIQAIEDQITEAIKNGKEFDFEKAVESSQELKDTLEYIGLDTEDVKDYFTQIGEEAKKAQDATSILSRLANTLDSIQSKYDTLQGAIDEFNERGAISGETLKSLIDNDLLQYLTFTENGLIADANAMQMLEQAAINEAYAMLNAAMVQDMENYALGKTEQMSALAQNAIGLAGNAAANAGAQAAQGAQGFLSFASAVAQAGIIDPGNLTAGLQEIYNAYQNIGNAIGHVSAYRPSDAYTGSGSDSGSSSNSPQEIDWIEHYYTEIENRIDELNARLENKISNVQALDAKNTIIDQIIDLYDQKQQKLANAVATYDARADYLFGTFSSDIQNKINNGSLDISSITDETLASNIEEYYEYIEAASQARVEAEELKQAIADLAKQKFDNISTAYENEIGLVDAYIDALQDQIDATEARGEQVGASYYEGMIDSAEKRKQSLEEERNALQASLDEAVKLGQVEVGSDTWYEMVNAIYEIDSAIVEAEISMEEWQDAINDLHWENFDKLISKLDGIASELDNIYERLTDNDEAFDENGNWTNQGIAALGMLTQKMEQAQFAAQQYADQIDKLNTDYAAGKYSEEEYNEKLAELTEGQWESIEAYESAKDEIVDLNKARVDAVNDGMQKELDAYKELIDAKKEALEADKKAHDWANSVAEKEKNILDIQRKLAALANDNSASANAQKKKLQSELLEAQKELEEAYYDKSIEDQQDALDQEYESYEENQQKEMDSLEEWLDDRETIIQDSFNLVKENTQVIYDELLNLSQEYGIEISDEIIAPWQAGKDAIGEYKDAFTNPELNAATSEFMSQLDSMKTKWEETADAAEDAAQRQIDAINEQVEAIIAAQKEIQENTPTAEDIGSMDNVGSDDSGSSGSSGGGGGLAGWGSGGTSLPVEDIEPIESNENEDIIPVEDIVIPDEDAFDIQKIIDDIIKFFTDTIPEVAGMILQELNKFFTETLPTKWNNFWNSVGLKFEELGTKAEELYTIVNTFFTVTIPEKWSNFWNDVNTVLTEDIPYAIGYLAGVVYGFFTVTLPEAWSEFWDNVNQFLTETLPNTLENVKSKIAAFFTEVIPNAWNEFWDNVNQYIEETIIPSLESIKIKLQTFFTETIPNEWNEFWDNVNQFIYETIPTALEEFRNKIVTFFTETIPNKWSEFWDNVDMAFFTPIQTAFIDICNDISAFFSGIPGYISGMWDDITGWISEQASSVWDSLTSGFTAGFNFITGGSSVDGTANVNGTAYKGGTWGAPKTETALTGELGPEILVRNGKWTTVGENGAEFTQVKKGDIIFNHKQAEQLLKHGHVTGRGKAYASGTTWKSTSNHLDDLGEELTMCAGPNGGLQFLSKGAASMATGTIGNLTNLAQFDTTDILNRSRPSIGVSPSVANNTMELKIDYNISELIHVDNLNGNNLDEIGKFVDKAWEKKMQTLNSSIKKYAR